ncbi:hypothetical protein TNCV_1298741 [Trichonephila clavipes]|nr:hypothetical protein TNCV_1298741 [Trichonephila clavipes]
MVELSAIWNVSVPNWKYLRNLESSRVSSPVFDNNSKIMVMGIDVSAQIASQVTTPSKDRDLAVSAKRNRRSAASYLSRQHTAATGTTISRQTEDG